MLLLKHPKRKFQVKTATGLNLLIILCRVDSLQEPLRLDAVWFQVQTWLCTEMTGLDWDLVQIQSCSQKIVYAKLKTFSFTKVFISLCN